LTKLVQSRWLDIDQDGCLWTVMWWSPELSGQSKIRHSKIKFETFKLLPANIKYLQQKQKQSAVMQYSSQKEQEQKHSWQKQIACSKTKNGGQQLLIRKVLCDFHVIHMPVWPFKRFLWCGLILIKILVSSTKFCKCPGEQCSQNCTIYCKLNYIIQVYKIIKQNT